MFSSIALYIVFETEIPVKPVLNALSRQHPGRSGLHLPGAGITSAATILQVLGLN